jgi:HNH endonuclease
MLTHERLRELLHYNPKTGLFRRLKSCNYNNALKGVIAGLSKNGERVAIAIDGKHYRAHRLAWFYMTGKWPKGVIDHRDGNQANNRFSNLRDVSRKLNQQNMRRAHQDNKTGYLGVTVYRGRYRATIWHNKKQHLVGMFDRAEDAHRAYVLAKRKLHAGCTL